MTSNDSPTQVAESRLQALIDAVNRINTLQPIDDLLLQMAREGARALEAQRCTVWLLDPEREELYSRVAMGVGDRQLRMPKHSGIAGDVLRTGRLSNVPDAAADPRFKKGLGQSDEFRTRSMLSVPLRDREGTTCGVFQVLNKQRGQQFSPVDERLAEAFASATAVALQNARTFESVKRDRDQLDEENVRLRQSIEEPFGPCEFIGNSPSILRVTEIARRVSDTDVSVMITGESGTGKTLLARCIHHHSSRRNHPFIDVNCAAIPETLLESELFGIEKGIATGVDRRIGKLEAADGGTIFLDEIGDMPPATQAKILRVVQEKCFERVGSRETRRVDVRIISATNKDLAGEIEGGRFREDLLYRLNVVTLHLPPLRERREDIPVLAAHLLKQLGGEYGRPSPRLGEEALARLAAYSWPGNVRELENEIARSLVLAGDREDLSVENLSEKLQQAPDRAEGGPALRTAGSLAEHVETLERRLITQARESTGGNKTRMARLLGLSREGLRKKLARYRMS